MIQMIMAIAFGLTGALLMVLNFYLLVQRVDYPWHVLLSHVSLIIFGAAWIALAVAYIYNASWHVSLIIFGASCIALAVAYIYNAP